MVCLACPVITYIKTYDRSKKTVGIRVNSIDFRKVFDQLFFVKWKYLKNPLEYFKVLQFQQNGFNIRV